MRALACSLALLLAASASTALAAAPASRAPRRTIDKSPVKAAPDRPVKITCDAFEVLAGQKQASCKGNVVILREDMKVRCKSLLTDYDDQNKPKKLTCSGNVHMRQAPRLERPEREVWGDLAVFDNLTAVLTVTGSPRAREGPNTMKGEKITFDSNADKLRVEHVTMVLDSPPDKDPLAPKPRPRPTPAAAPDARAKEPSP